MQYPIHIVIYIYIQKHIVVFQKRTVYSYGILLNTGFPKQKQTQLLKEMSNLTVYLLAF